MNNVPFYIKVKVKAKVKVKVNFTLEQATKARGGVDYSSTLSLTLALDEGGW